MTLEVPEIVDLLLFSGPVIKQNNTAVKNTWENRDPLPYGGGKPNEQTPLGVELTSCQAPLASTTRHPSVSWAPEDGAVTPLLPFEFLLLPLMDSCALVCISRDRETQLSSPSLVVCAQPK